MYHALCRTCFSADEKRSTENGTYLNLKNVFVFKTNYRHEQSFICYVSDIVCMVESFCLTCHASQDIQTWQEKTLSRLTG